MLEEEYNKIKISLYELWVSCVALASDGSGEFLRIL